MSPPSLLPPFWTVVSESLDVLSVSNPDTLGWEIAESVSLLRLPFFLLQSVLSVSSSRLFSSSSSLAHFSLFPLSTSISRSPSTPSALCISISLVEVRAVSRSCVILSAAVSPLLQTLHDWPVNARWVENYFETFSCQTLEMWTLRLLDVSQLMLFHISSTTVGTVLCCAWCRQIELLMFSCSALRKWSQVKVIISQFSPRLIYLDWSTTITNEEREEELEKDF